MAYPGFWSGRFVDPRTAPCGQKLLQWDSVAEPGDGAGVRVALFDSGLSWASPVFSGASISARDFTGERWLRDPTGHGTAMASLLVSQSAGPRAGLVPRAHLLFARVLGGADRAATERAMLGAVRWVVEHGADVLVLPFGTQRASARLARALAWAARSGTVVIAAAGNRGPEVIAFPAWLDCVLAVTGADDNGQVLPECCSPERADLVAPGYDLREATLQGHARVRGSSTAAVLAAGVQALRFSAAQQAHHERI